MTAEGWLGGAWLQKAIPGIQQRCFAASAALHAQPSADLMHIVIGCGFGTPLLWQHPASFSFLISNANTLGSFHMLAYITSDIDLFSYKPHASHQTATFYSHFKSATE